MISQKRYDNDNDGNGDVVNGDVDEVLDDDDDDNNNNNNNNNE
jgi:hypothetical protein